MGKKLFLKVVILFFIVSCNNKKENNLDVQKTETEVHINDSLSRIEEKQQIDLISDYKAKYKSKKYNLRIEKDCDLNMDGQTDKIIIFEPSEVANNKLTKESPVCVFIKKEKGYDIYENRNIIYTSFFNSMAEGYQDLVVKDNYFTFEENNQAGEVRGNDYITFKYDLKSNEILLYKYSIELITVDGENDKTFTYDNRLFGKIFFKDFDIDTIKEKI